MHKFCKYAYEDVNPRVKNWSRVIWSNPHIEAQFDPKMLYMLNDNLNFDRDVVERLFSAHTKTYTKGLNLCTRKSCHNYQYDNSWISMNGEFYNIVEILCDQYNTTYIVGQLLICKEVFYNVYSYVISDIYTVMKIQDSIQQCINMSIKLPDKTLQYISKCKIRTQID